jgi:hypothetical protein
MARLGMHVNFRGDLSGGSVKAGAEDEVPIFGKRVVV